MAEADARPDRGQFTRGGTAPHGLRLRVYAALLFAVFLDLVGFGMVIPDVQTRLEEFGARGWQIGLVLSSYFLIQIAASPLWGKFSDRVGRKSVLIGCGLISATSLLVYAFAHSVILVLISRLLAGLAGASVAAAQAYIADVTTDLGEVERTTALGKVSAAITAGLMLGPALGGWLAGIGSNHLLGVVAASIVGLGVVWIVLVVPSSRPVQPQIAETRGDGKDGLRGTGRMSLLKDVPALRPMFILAAVIMLALACLEGTFGRLIAHRLGLGPREFGLIFGYESLVSVLMQSMLLKRLLRRLHSRNLLGAALVFQGAGLALMPFALNIASLFGASTLYGIGAGLAMPTLNGLTSDVTPRMRQGEMFGLMQGARSFGFLVGPSVGGVLFDWRVEAPYLLSASVLFLAALVTPLLIDGERQDGIMDKAQPPNAL